MSAFLQNHRKLAIGLGAGAAAIVLGVVLFLIFRDPGYRTIRLYQLDGDAEIKRASAPIDVYVDMMLESGDHVRTMEDSWLYLKLDDDKYVLAEPLTSFGLIATGTKKDSLTKFDLEIGALVNHIKEDLSENSSYEVETPNSVMAVRGTSFRVEVWFDDEGVSHTILQVFEGIVEVHLKYPDGSLSEEGRLFESGTTVSIWGNDDTSDYDYILNEIDYISLDIPTLEFLKIGILGSDDYDVTIPTVDEIIALKLRHFDVTFEYNGEVFGTQSIQFDHLASEPTLKPAQNGHWDFDFTTPIREEVTIEWVQ